MKRPGPCKLIPLAISTSLAVATLFGALCVEVLVFRVIFTESGLYLESTLDDLKTTQVQFSPPRGRFWNPPGASAAWPFVAVAIPHWLHIGLSLGWCVLPSRRKDADDSHCDSCGYNLTGNESGKCPECGAALSSAPAQPPSKP